MPSFAAEPSYIALYGKNQQIIGIDASDIAGTIDLYQCTITLAGEELVVLSAYGTDDKTAYFNLSRMIPFSYDLPGESLIGSFLTQSCSNIIKYIQVKIGADNNNLITEYWALWGHVDHITARSLDFFQNRKNPPLKFLTNQPMTKYVTREQPEFLYFLTALSDEETPLTHTLTVTATLSDGSTGTITKTYSAARGNVQIIPVGFKQLGVDTLEGGVLEVLSYTVRLNMGTGYSETRTFIIDYDKQDWPKRYILFQNRLGGMDTICCRGKAGITTNYQRTERRIAEQYGVDRRTHRETNDEVLSQQQVELSIGWVEEDVRYWLEELGEARNAWEVNVQKNRFIPIRITSGSLDILQDDEPLQAASFTYTYEEL